MRYYDGLIDGIRMAVALIQQDGLRIEDVARLVDGVDLGDDEVREAHLEEVRRMLATGELLDLPAPELPALTVSETGFDDMGIENNSVCDTR